MNKSLLIGRLTNDLEIRTTNSGKKMVAFTIAVDRRTKEKQTDFIQCEAWEQTAETMAAHLKKGAKIGLEGYIITGQYQHPKYSDVTIYTTKVRVESFDFCEAKQQQEQMVNIPQSGVVTRDDLPF